MQRVKNIDYDDDDLYSDEEEGGYEGGGEEAGYTAEDRENFATLTPVVQAELQEVGLHAPDKEIEEALWHYYWDVGKSVAYLKNTRTPRPQQQEQHLQQQQSGKTAKQAKPQSKFDQAAQRSAEKAGECDFSFARLFCCTVSPSLGDFMGWRGAFNLGFTLRGSLADRLYLRCGTMET